MKVLLEKNAHMTKDIPNLGELKHVGGHFTSHYKSILSGAEVEWTVTNTTNKKLRFWYGEETRRYLINGVNEVCFDLKPTESKTLTLLNKVAMGVLPKTFEMRVQEASPLPPVKEMLNFKVGPKYYDSVEKLIATIDDKVKKVTGSDGTKGFTLIHEAGITKLKLESKVESVNLGKGLQRVFGFSEQMYSDKAKSVLPADLSNGIHQLLVNCSLVLPMPTPQRPDTGDPLLGLLSIAHNKFGKFITRTFDVPIYRPMNNDKKANFTIWNQGRLATFLIDVTEILLHIKPK